MIIRISRGDRDAFGELYRDLAGKIYGYLKTRLSEEAAIDDVMQETFMAVWRSSGSFKNGLSYYGVGHGKRLI